MDLSTIQNSTIQVWGKGFRVSIDSEEFQRLVPRERGLNDPMLESYLDRIGTWGSFLEPLYRLTERELATQKCILFGEQESMSISVASTEDRHGRGSIVLVAVTTKIQWESDDLAGIIAQTQELSSRLAKTYSTTLLRAPEHVQQQLREGTFLTDRSFQIMKTASYDSLWDDIIRGVKTWNGITGVATPSLCPIGANIVIGTKHESERLSANRLSIDGYFDSRERTIVPLSNRISPWPRPVIQSTIDQETDKQEEPIADITLPNPIHDGNNDLEIKNQQVENGHMFESNRRILSYQDPNMEIFVSIHQTLKSIDKTLQSFASPAARFFDKFVDYIFLDKRKGKR